MVAPPHFTHLALSVFTHVQDSLALGYGTIDQRILVRFSAWNELFLFVINSRPITGVNPDCQKGTGGPFSGIAAIEA
jgi:hypothetical protein